MIFRKFFISAIYACFVFLNAVPVHACEMQVEDTCCSSSCCADEPMDCCEIEDEGGHSNAHALTPSVKLKAVATPSTILDSFVYKRVYAEQFNKGFQIERPPPLGVKFFLAYRKLVLYA